MRSRPSFRCATLIAAAALAVLAACSSQDLYQTGQGWQKQQCIKLQDRDERARCDKSTALSWERYKAEAEAAKQPPR